MKPSSECFTEDAIVKDEGHTHHGRAAIKKWKEEASTKYEYTCEPLGCERRTANASSRAGLLETFPAARSTFASSSNLKAERSRR